MLNYPVRQPSSHHPHRAADCRTCILGSLIERALNHEGAPTRTRAWKMTERHAVRLRSNRVLCGAMLFDCANAWFESSVR